MTSAEGQVVKLIIIDSGHPQSSYHIEHYLPKQIHPPSFIIARNDIRLKWRVKGYPQGMNNKLRESFEVRVESRVEELLSASCLSTSDVHAKPANI